MSYPPPPLLPVPQTVPNYNPIKKRRNTLSKSALSDANLWSLSCPLIPAVSMSIRMVQSESILRVVRNIVQNIICTD